MLWKEFEADLINMKRVLSYFSIVQDLSGKQPDYKKLLVLMNGL